MNSLNEERSENRTRGQQVLNKLKEKEKQINFFERRIGKNTIVYCKNEKRLDEYEASYNNIRNW